MEGVDGFDEIKYSKLDEYLITLKNIEVGIKLLLEKKNNNKPGVDSGLLEDLLPNSDKHRIIDEREDEIKEITFHFQNAEEMEMLQLELDQKEKSIVKLVSKCKKMESWKDDLELKKQYIEELEIRLKEYESKGDEFKSINRKVKSLKNNIKEKESQIMEMEEDFVAMKHELEKSSKELRTTKKELKNTRNELNEVQDSNTGYENLIKDLKKKLKEAEKECFADRGNEMHASEIKDLKATINKKDRENERLSNENDDLKKEKSICEKNFKLRSDDNIKIKKEINDLTDKLENANDQIKIKDNQIKEKQEAINTMKDKVLKSNKESEDVKLLERKINENQLMINEYDRKVQNAQISLNAKYEECISKTKEIQKLKDEIADLNIEIFKLRRILSSGAHSNPNRNSTTEMNAYPDWWKKHMM